MATIQGRPTLTTQITIALDEDEAAALNTLAAYGTDAFLEIFYKYLGETYLQPHEKGLRSLFKSLQNGPCSIGSILERARTAKEVFIGTKIAVNK